MMRDVNTSKSRCVRLPALGLILPVLLFGGSDRSAQMRMIDIGTLGGASSGAMGINNQGQVVGYSETAGGSSIHAFLWENGKMTDLGTLGQSIAYGINNQGHVVGYTADGISVHAFLWENGKMTDLGTLGDFSKSAAYGINDRGQVVGSSWTDPNDGTPHAFLWENGKMTDLGTLGMFGGTYSQPRAINDHGQVVVDASFGRPNQTVAFLWEKGGLVTKLGTLGGSWSAAVGINNRGQVVGQSEVAAGDGWAINHAFLWEQGKMSDLLGTLGGASSWAHAVNQRGEVVGSASINGHAEHAFLLKVDNGDEEQAGH